MDRNWWTKYLADVKKNFTGECYSALGVYQTRRSPADTFGNSGAAAINLAAHVGAKKILLLGYDCQHTCGKTHWHGSHPKGLPDAGRVGYWPAQFAKLAGTIKHTTVLNCSRESALTCWPRAALEDALHE